MAADSIHPGVAANRSAAFTCRHPQKLLCKPTLTGRSRNVAGVSLKAPCHALTQPTCAQESRHAHTHCAVCQLHVKAGVGKHHAYPGQPREQQRFAGDASLSGGAAAGLRRGCAGVISRQACAHAAGRQVDTEGGETRLRRGRSRVVSQEARRRAGHVRHGHGGARRPAVRAVAHVRAAPCGRFASVL